MRQKKEAPSVKHEHTAFDKQTLENVEGCFWGDGERAREFCSPASILKRNLLTGRKTSSGLGTKIEILVLSLTPAGLMVRFFHLFFYLRQR